MNFLELTVNREVPVDDGQKKTVPVKILLNWDHIRLVQPRLEGGSVITLADNASIIVAESKADITKALGGQVD
jgi:hypothetical protein